MKFKNYIEFINEATLSKKDNIGKKMTLNGKKMKILPKDSERVRETKLKRQKFFEKLGFNVTTEVTYLGTDNDSYDIEDVFPGSKDPKLTFYFEIAQQIILIKSSSSLDTYFNHSKADSCSAVFATEIKETASMIMFRENTELSETQLKDFLYAIDQDYVKYWKHIFYTSAIAQLKSYKEIGMSKSGLYFERQGKNYSKELYDVAAKYSGLKSPDNWNPSDVWVFSNKGISNLEKLKYMKSLVELNEFVKDNLSSKDIVGISLKQVTKKAKLKLNNMGEELISDLDFSLKKDVGIPLSFKSIMVYTESGYFLKGNMRGSGNTLNLNFEGRFEGKDYNEGAFPAELWVHYKNTHNGENLISGSKTPEVDKELFAEAKAIFTRFKGWVKNSKDILKLKYNDLSDYDRRRYWIIATHLEYIIDQGDDLMKYSFFSSQKLHDKASAFYKIAE